MNLNILKARQFLDRLQGYKLENVHFRIGSKYHSDTFVHARVLLQNSYFTSRIALILGKRINDICHEKSFSTITLVGYERYSELLLGLMTNFLQAMDPHIFVSICIMADKGEMDPVKMPDSMYNQFFTIVPIASTGNTAERIIKTYVRLTNNKGQNVYTFHVFQLSSQEYLDNMVSSNLESLIKVPVNWYLPHLCDLCYDEKQSRPLFHADKSHLNPVTIFGFPTIKKVVSITDEEKYQRNEVPMEPDETDKLHKVSVYGCAFRDAIFSHSLEYHKDNHFNDFREYSHNSDRFILDNKKGIEAWIDSLRIDLGIQATDKVFILSPCHIMTNIGFVNLINNRLFGSTATVIYLEPGKEYPENFKSVNQDFLCEQPDASNKVFYVDDDLVTGKTFFQIYDLFRFSSGYGKVVLSGSIFLMNKAAADINERVCRASGCIHAYVSINLPQSYIVSGHGPFSREIQRYEGVMNRCLYYEQQNEFNDKCESLKRFDRIERNRDRHLQMFIATHVLYEIFSQYEKMASISDLSFDRLWEECRKRDNRLKDRTAVLKVLVRDSFLMYKPIKEKVFDWVKDETTKTIKKIEEMTSSSAWYENTCLKELLFMIHRSVLVANYQIVSEHFFSMLSSLLGEIKDNGEMAKVTTVFGENSVSAPDNFVNSILKRYCELIAFNPAVSVQIVKNISNVSFKPRDEKQFKSRLIDETYIVLQDLYEYMLALGLPANYILDNDKDSFVSDDEFVRKVKLWIDTNNIDKSTRYIWAEKVSRNGDSILTRQFFQYIWLKSFIICDRENELPKKDSLIERKTDMLCQHLKTIVNPEKKVGLFFVITDVLGKQRLVYDEDASGYSVLRNRLNDPLITKFLNNLMRGVKEDSRVFVEFEDECNEEGNKEIQSILNSKKLQVLRITDVSDDSISGLVGIYSDHPFALNNVGRRYLLLMRRDILHFIKHHHKNDEFSKSVMAEERRKFAYLTGHGREIMLRLSWKNPDFISIISTQERLQSIFSGGHNSVASVKSLLDIFFPCQTYGDKDKTEFINSIKSIAQFIYENDIVEIGETPNYWEFNTKGKGSFSFNPELLKYICFELILNAKKNRYHKCSEPYGRVYEKIESPFESNSIGLLISCEEREVIISVSGTGPDIPADIVNRINANTQIKEKEDISGLDLIIKLIKEYNTLNRISIKKEYSSVPTVFKNTVSVHLQLQNE